VSEVNSNRLAKNNAWIHFIGLAYIQIGIGQIWETFFGRATILIFALKTHVSELYCFILCKIVAPDWP
jgi:hypothetical protein